MMHGGIPMMFLMSVFLTLSRLVLFNAFLGHLISLVCIFLSIKLMSDTHGKKVEMKVLLIIITLVFIEMLDCQSSGDSSYVMVFA
jgi:hypothetical protein